MGAPGRDLLAAGEAGLASLFADVGGACSPPDAPPPAPFGDAVLVDVSLPRSVRVLARTLFQPGSPFQASWAEQLKATDVREAPWELRPAGGPGGAPVAVREVHMATPPPPAWGYMVGSTPIGSRRAQTLLLAREGQAVCVEETNHLSMPFGNSFHTALQYYIAAEGPESCRLRVTFKLVFGMRAAAMKGVLTAMVRGEHVKVFDTWITALQRFLAGSADGAPARPPALRVTSGVTTPRNAPATPVAMLATHAPHIAAVFGAGALAGAAMAILCAAMLHALTGGSTAAGDFVDPQSPLHLLRRKAESAASGHYEQAGVFLRVVGSALVFARSQPVSLALALLLLLLAAAALLRFAQGSAATSSSDPFAWGGDRKRGGGAAAPRGSTPRPATPRAPSAAGPSAGAAADGGAGSGPDGGVPGCIVHSTDQAEASSAVDSVVAAAVPEPPPPVVRGPITAPEENAGVVRGVARLSSRAGRDDAAADVAEVFSVLAGDFLGRPKTGDVASAAAPVVPSPDADREWALDGYGLNEEACAVAVVEEVFENSRYMPLQGWGSSYPGHLLPTDRRRWSRLDATVCADQLREIVWLPPGWAWAGVWRKDMRGAEVGAVDSEGWSYAVDFKFLKHPPTEGCGKESTLRCVRRRRWVRVRIPSPVAPTTTPQNVAAPQRASEAVESAVGADASPGKPMREEQADDAAAASSGAASAACCTPEEASLLPQPPAAESDTGAADGWDCDLPELDPPAETEPASPTTTAAAAAAAASALTPLLERARAAVVSPQKRPSLDGKASAQLRVALLAFLEEEDEQAQADNQPGVAPPPDVPPPLPAASPAPSPRDTRSAGGTGSRASLDDDGSLFDMRAGILLADAQSPPLAKPHLVQARRTVTTPDRCEPPRVAARSWTTGVRSSFEAATGAALADI